MCETQRRNRKAISTTMQLPTVPETPRFTSRILHSAPSCALANPQPIAHQRDERFVSDESYVTVLFVAADGFTVIDGLICSLVQNFFFLLPTQQPAVRLILVPCKLIQALFPIPTAYLRNTHPMKTRYLRNLVKAFPFIAQHQYTQSAADVFVLYFSFLCFD